MSRALRRAAVPALVLAGGVIARGRLEIPALLAWAALASVGFSVSAEAAPDLIVYAGFVFGTALAMLVSGTAVVMGIVGFAAAVSVRKLDPGRLGTQCVIAVLLGFPLMYGAIAVGLPAEGALPWTLAAWLALVLQLTSRLEQGVPDSSSRRLTIGTAALSIALVPASLVWPAHASYHGAYFLIAVFAELFLLAAATRVLVGRTYRVSLLVEGAMLVGLIALVAGRIG
ncbi:MAG TPA: hypothetical protein VLV45_00035 [Gemmatimonadales bacterium]|nr:hypothetical protein [Gemmatimonadales bacterium]